MIKRPISIDKSEFHKNSVILDARYGLPREVLYCKKCVISNQRPNSAVEYEHGKDSIKKTIYFDEHGVCDACRIAERKAKEINWLAREKELEILCDKYRSKDGGYDCIVPGSGGKDSFYAAHILKNKYGMHPLTVTWAPHMYTDWGWKNFQSWVHAGFDNYLHTPNGKVHRLLTRLAVDNLFHPFQPFMIGQKTLAPKMAILHKIPLVFYGENEAEYGNPMDDIEEAQRNWKYFAINKQRNILLGGVSVLELKERFGVLEQDLIPYYPVNPVDMEKNKIEVHYLGYYLKWHPQSCYYYAKEHSNFQASPERTSGTYSKYNSIDDKIDDLHYYTTGVKFGIGRASYDASQEIRSGDITREEGVNLVNKFDHEFPGRFINEIFDYLSIPRKDYPLASKVFEEPIMSMEYFNNLADSFRSQHLWVCGEKDWELRVKID